MLRYINSFNRFAVPPPSLAPFYQSIVGGRDLRHPKTEIFLSEYTKIFALFVYQQRMYSGKNFPLTKKEFITCHSFSTLI